MQADESGRAAGSAAAASSEDKPKIALEVEVNINDADKNTEAVAAEQPVKDKKEPVVKAKLPQQVTKADNMDPTLDPEVSKLGESKESSQELKAVVADQPVKDQKEPVAK